MKVEQLPLFLGVLVALGSLTILLDAWQAGGIAPLRERRRRTRAVPSKAGQTLVALGMMCTAAALRGLRRDGLLQRAEDPRLFHLCRGHHARARLFQDPREDLPRRVHREP